MATQHPRRSRARRRKRTAATTGTLSQRSLIIGFVVICVVALGIFVVRSAARSGDTGANGTDPANPAQLAQGQSLYASRCAGCHGATLQGEPGWPERRPNGTMPASPLNASGPAWQHDDQWLFTTIKEGGQATAPPGYTSAMPALDGGMTDEQIWTVIAYIKSTWPANIQTAQPQVQQMR
jgi:mono/diheme cytochrome c family protein